MTSTAQSNVLDAIEEHAEQIAALGPDNESLGRLTDDAAKLLRDSGVMRMLQPAEYGGAEAHPREFAETVMRIASLDGSTGWVAGIVGVHPWEMALCDARVQAEVWAEDHETWIASPYAPMGILTPVEGGYRFSGRWQFSSGTDHCDWIFLGAMLGDAEGQMAMPPQNYHVILPRSDYTIVEDSWDVVGLRGTGSNDIVVRRAFVPTHRTLRHREQQELSGPGQAVNTGPLYRLPFATVFTSAVTAPVLGAAAGGLEAYVRHMRQRVRVSPSRGRFADDPFAQVAVARAGSEIEAAVLQMDNNLAGMYDAAARHEPIDLEARLRARRDQVLGTERALGAIDLLFKTAGGNSLHRGNPIERAWRDAHAGSVHVANDVERALCGYGRHAFGREVEDSLM